MLLAVALLVWVAVFVAYLTACLCCRLFLFSVAGVFVCCLRRLPCCPVSMFLLPLMARSRGPQSVAWIGSSPHETWWCRPKSGQVREGQT